MATEGEGCGGRAVNADHHRNEFFDFHGDFRGDFHDGGFREAVGFTCFENFERFACTGCEEDQGVSVGRRTWCMIVAQRSVGDQSRSHWSA